MQRWQKLESDLCSAAVRFRPPLRTDMGVVSLLLGCVVYVALKNQSNLEGNYKYILLGIIAALAIIESIFYIKCLRKSTREEEDDDDDDSLSIAGDIPSKPVQQRVSVHLKKAENVLTTESERSEDIQVTQESFNSSSAFPKITNEKTTEQTTNSSSGSSAEPKSELSTVTEVSEEIESPRSGKPRFTVRRVRSTEECVWDFDGV